MEHNAPGGLQSTLHKLEWFSIAPLTFGTSRIRFLTMYALAILRYRRPFDEVAPHVDEHRAYLRELKAAGTLIASGPFEPRFGGGILLRVPDEDSQAALDRIRDGDPFTKRSLAHWEIWPWHPVIGKEDLDRL
jgi:uncharacterized protein YciI